MIVRFKAVLVITLHGTKKEYICVQHYGGFYTFLSDIFFECFSNLVETRKQFFS